jgi:hypothetical protein
MKGTLHQERSVTEIAESPDKAANKITIDVDSIQIDQSTKKSSIPQKKSPTHGKKRRQPSLALDTLESEEAKKVTPI